MPSLLLGRGEPRTAAHRQALADGVRLVLVGAGPEIRAIAHVDGVLALAEQR
jgi:hypothetical protein